MTDGKNDGKALTDLADLGFADSQKVSKQGADDILLGIPDFSVDSSVLELPRAGVADVATAQQSVSEQKLGDQQLIMDAAVMQLSLAGLFDLPIARQVETKTQLKEMLADSLAEYHCVDCLTLDVDDGFVLAFAHEPSDALKVGRKIRSLLGERDYQDHLGLKAHIGISFGDVTVSHQGSLSVLFGKAADQAAYLMRLAGINQLVVSSGYHAMLESISSEYVSMFRYGGIQVDKNGEGHEIYELDEGAHQAKQAIQSKPKIVLTESAQVERSAPSVKVVAKEDDEHAELMKSATSLLDGDVVLKVPQSTLHSTPVLAPELPEPIVDMSHLPSPDEVSELAKQEVKEWNKTTATNELKLEGDVPKPTVKSYRIEPGAVSSRSESVSVAYRKPLPVKEIFVGVLGLLLVALLVAPFVMPLHEQAAKVAKMASARIGGQPVHAADMQVKLLPLPHLLVKDITMGAGSELKIGSAQLYFDYRELFSNQTPLNRVVFSDVQFSGGMTPNIASWMRQIGKDAAYPIREIEFERLAISSPEFSLADLVGRIRFTADGTFETARLLAPNDLYQLDLFSESGKMMVKFVVHDGALPFLNDWHFSDLTVNAELLSGELMIPLYEGFIKGGKVKGNARFVWSEGWQLYGNMLADRLTAEELNRALVGNVDGKAQFKMFSNDLKSLTDHAEMSGSFVVRKGALLGVDVADTIRERRKQSVPGGRTYFDTLSGSFSARDGSYSFSGLQMSADLLSATGAVNVVKQNVAGRLFANLRVSRSATATLVAKGSLSKPELSVVN